MTRQNNASVIETLEIPEHTKTCFVIMPISEMDAYGSGHFKRVYEHIIKPACFKAGFMPIRADEVHNTNFIALDIIKRIIESDMAICDLSAKNPNVFYELGIRQAFDLPAVLIKDKKTGRVFDISALRDFEYDENLRIDNVESSVDEIATLLINTYQSHTSKTEVNSLVSLLGVNAAQVSNPVTVSTDTKLILEGIENLGKRISSVEDKVSDVQSDNTTLNFRRQDGQLIIGEPVKIRGAAILSTNVDSMGKRAVITLSENAKKLIEKQEDPIVIK